MNGIFSFNTWNWTKELLLMSSLTTLLVLSRNRVSFGDNLWNTTLEMDDLPLLYVYIMNMIIDWAKHVTHTVSIPSVQFLVYSQSWFHRWLHHPRLDRSYINTHRKQLWNTKIIHVRVELTHSRQGTSLLHCSYAAHCLQMMTVPSQNIMRASIDHIDLPCFLTRSTLSTLLLYSHLKYMKPGWPELLTRQISWSHDCPCAHAQNKLVRCHSFGRNGSCCFGAVLVLAVRLFTTCSFNHSISPLQTAFVQESGELIRAIQGGGAAAIVYAKRRRC